ncbi:cupin domain-containing protein [Haladaptatus sp. DYSN1]|uniref:cupin domain-containing protein n=1 Tax=unclassified Haladaptatus TaxID=2622732 RepID=UPI002404E68A|nr:cupin domain-containing protein [Haladaptatus sp. DYSN1]
MPGYVTNIERETQNNDDFRHVLFTADHVQLVLMTLRPGADIGLETHPNIDQFIRVESGTATAVLDGEESRLGDGDVIVIPAGTEHNVTNTADNEPLRLYTLYSPPAHPDGTVQATKPQDERH